MLDTYQSTAKTNDLQKLEKPCSKIRVYPQNLDVNVAVFPSYSLRVNTLSR